MFNCAVLLLCYSLSAAGNVIIIVIVSICYAHTTKYSSMFSDSACVLTLSLINSHIIIFIIIISTGVLFNTTVEKIEVNSH